MTDEELAITEEQAVDLLKSHGLYDFLRYFVTEDEFIMRCQDVLTETQVFTAISSGIKISQNLIEWFIKEEFMSLEDISNLSMTIYSSLDKSFVNSYNDYINWEKMIVYLTSTDQLDLSKYIDIIESKDLWNVISTTPLPIEFIRKNKDKLKWNVVSILNDFTEEEVEEFEEYLLKANSIEIVDNTVNLNTQEIYETFNKNGLYNSKETIDEIDDPVNLSPEEMHKLKALLNIIM